MNSRRLHSITSSARARSVCGKVRPSAFAVLRFMTSSILVAAVWGGRRVSPHEESIGVGGRTLKCVYKIGAQANKATRNSGHRVSRKIVGSAYRAASLISCVAMVT